MRRVQRPGLTRPSGRRRRRRGPSTPLSRSGHHNAPWKFASPGEGRDAGRRQSNGTSVAALIVCSTRGPNHSAGCRQIRNPVSRRNLGPSFRMHRQRERSPSGRSPQSTRTKCRRLLQIETLSCRSVETHSSNLPAQTHASQASFLHILGSQLTRATTRDLRHPHG